MLARQAASLDPSPHVLDTLAECYFVNGDIPAAIHYEQKAIAMAEDNLDYYRQQLARFKKALGAN